MSKTAKTILSLTSNEALDFFMKSEQYHSFELPEYFNFDKILDYVKNAIGDKNYEDCLTDTIPDVLENVNLGILLNKDGHYAVRPLILANPFLYCFWQERFAILLVGKPSKNVLKHIKCHTLPHVLYL